MSFVEEQGLIAQKQFDSNSLDQDLAHLEAKLKTREDLLAKYFGILEKSGVEHVIAVESEVIRLVTEIEHLKGQIRKMSHQTQYANIHIFFEFRDRSAPVSQGDSPFEWINTLNLTDLLYGFQNSQDQGAVKTEQTSIPENFALYKSKKDCMAASSTGVVYRIRTEKPKPQASDLFWAEAVTRRMSEAGYFSYTASSEQFQSEPLGIGHVLKLAAPNGSDDFAYWIGFKVEGKRLVVVEAAGEVVAFQESETAILAAFTQVLSE